MPLVETRTLPSAAFARRRLQRVEIRHARDPLQGVQQGYESYGAKLARLMLDKEEKELQEDDLVSFRLSFSRTPFLLLQFVCLPSF